jgi:hypothetical protein
LGGTERPTFSVGLYLHPPSEPEAVKRFPFWVRIRQGDFQRNSTRQKRCQEVLKIIHKICGKNCENFLFS